MSQDSRLPPADADEAEARGLELASELLALLDDVAVPSSGRDAWLPERLSFLLARDNYGQCLRALRDGRDITAGSLARALFEEAIRWSWVDEDEQGRRSAFLDAAVRRHRQVDEAARELGIDPGMFYGPMVGEVVVATYEPVRFPRQIESHLDWGPEELGAMMYTQYRLLSQYTHSSLLAGASAADAEGEILVLGRLPQPARLTILRNAVANMAVVVDGCKRGLVDGRSAVPGTLNMDAMGIAMEVADVVYAYAPASD